ncbi:MAG TPA: hypothetical protein VFQ96_00625 [Microbacteriaceae bacterium]|nr:hypothetical protein [Microbacteriaceae bacterium]
MTAENATAPAGRPTAVQKARADLVATLNEIEDRLNVPKRVWRSVTGLRRGHPWLFAAAATAGAAALGAAGWLAVAVRRR